MTLGRLLCGVYLLCKAAIEGTYPFSRCATSASFDVQLLGYSYLLQTFTTGTLNG